MSRVRVYRPDVSWLGVYRRGNLAIDSTVHRALSWSLVTGRRGVLINGRRISHSGVDVRILITSLGLGLRRRCIGRVDRAVRRASVLLTVWESGSILARRNPNRVANSQGLGAVVADGSGVVRAIGRSSDGDSNVNSLGRGEDVVGRTLDSWLKSSRVGCRGGRVLGRDVAVHRSVACRSVVGRSVAWRSVAWGSVGILASISSNSRLFLRL